MPSAPGLLVLAVADERALEHHVVVLQARSSSVALRPKMPSATRSDTSRAATR